MVGEFNTNPPIWWLIFVTMSDIGIAIAYVCIPLEILYFLRYVRQPYPYNTLIVLFAAFILSCGVSHLVMSGMSYIPMWVANGVVKFATAVISLYTSYHLLRVIPKVLQFPEYARLMEVEVGERASHEYILRESLRIQDRFREITKQLREHMTEDLLYKNMAELLWTYLHQHTLIYIFDSPTSKGHLVHKHPEGIRAPETLGFSFTAFTTGESVVNLHVILDSEEQWSMNIVDTDEIVNEYFKIIIFAYMARDAEHVTVTVEQPDESTNQNLPVALNVPLSDDYMRDIVPDIVQQFGIAIQQVRTTKALRNNLIRLQDRNEALMKAREETNKVMAENKQWLSVLSHEMRTPLFPVISLTNLLLDNIHFVQHDELKDSLTIVKRSGEHLSEIVNNVLDFSKYQDETFSLDEKPFSWKLTAEEAVALNIQDGSRLYPRISLMISEDLPQVVMGDALRVRQILNNLINNAIKFTPDEGQVVVNVSLKENGGGNDDADSDADDIMIVCSVKDTGVGIKEEMRPRLFQVFAQGDSYMTRRFGGTGIGLWICARLCRLMKGRITYRPNGDADTGSIFEVLLRAKRYDDRQDPLHIINTIPHLKDPLKEYKIVVVNEDATQLKYMKSFYTMIGCHDVTERTELPTGENEGFDFCVIDFRSFFDKPQEIEAFVKNAFESQVVCLYITPFMREYVPDCVKHMFVYPPLHELVIDLIERKGIEDGKIKGDVEAYGDQPKFSHVGVLVAEDDKINQQVIKRLLKKLGITDATFADDGDIAVQKYIENPQKYNVIFMDVMMPNMDGIEATKRIREKSRRDTIPWITCLSASAFWEDKVRAYEVGMNDFLAKPAKLEGLIGALRKYMKNQ